MNRVERKPFGEYIFKREQGLIANTDVSIFDARRNLYTPGFIALILAGSFFLFSFFSRVALLLLLTEISGLALLYMHTWLIARQVGIKRVLAKRPYREMDQAEVIIEIRNKSDWTLSGLIVEDSFGCAKNFHVRSAPDVIRPRAMLRFAYDRVCDGGMGKHKIGPLLARVTDPLGIFEFRIVDDAILEIEVYPRIDSIHPLPVRASVEASRYGNYEVASRGLSVNFSGVRGYVSGDSLRHVAWKLSARGQGLLVKEFEKAVSCDVSVVLNLEARWQIGRHSSSTWECAKDVALSVIEQQLELGNTVGFFSDRSFVEPKSGSEHFHSLVRHVSELSTFSDGANFEVLKSTSVLERYQSLYPRGSNFFYITPFNLAELQESEPWLKRLSVEGFTVTCIFIDTNTFWMQFIESISTGLLIGAKLMQGLEETSARLKREGIPNFIVKHRQPLREALRPDRQIGFSR